jgi:hypothetical protein
MIDAGQCRVNAITIAIALEQSQCMNVVPWTNGMRMRGSWRLPEIRQDCVFTVDRRLGLNGTV